MGNRFVDLSGTDFYQFEDMSSPSDNSNQEMVGWSLPFFGGLSSTQRKVLAATPQGRMALAANDLKKAAAGNSQIKSGIRKIAALAKRGNPKAKAQMQTYKAASKALSKGAAPALPMTGPGLSLFQWYALGINA